MPKRHRPQPVTIRHPDGRSEVVAPSKILNRKWSYKRYRRSKKWQDLRQKALERDGHRCKTCKGKTHLEVHHITYERMGREELDDLITLCRRCHATEHQWARRQGREVTHWDRNVA